MANKLPVKKFKAGGVEVSIWENEFVGRSGEAGVAHSVKLERRYKDKEGNWQGTGSLKEVDIPKAVLALNKAYEWIVLPAVHDDGGDVI